METRTRTSLAFAAALTLLAKPVLAQAPLDESAADAAAVISDEPGFSGYGGPAVTMTQLAGSTGLLVGGRAGWQVLENVALGGAGYGLATQVNMPPLADLGSGSHPITLGMGGLWFEYKLGARQRVHASLGTLVGGGTVGYRAQPPARPQIYRSSTIFVLAPEVTVEVNATPWLRIALGAGYRDVHGVDLEGLGNGDVSGPTASLIFSFGRF